MKELKFHPQYHTLLATTAADSFNVFRPNLDPDDEANQIAEDMEMIEEESKDVSTSSEKPFKKIKPSTDVWQSSSDEEEEERRANRVAR